MTDRWIAPKTGWYRLSSGHAPEYLGTEPPEADSDGTWTTISFETTDLPEVGEPVVFAVPPDQVTVTYMRFEQGDLTTSSGPLPPAPEPSITIPWNGE